MSGILPEFLFGEGSKEIYIGTHNVRLFSCNDPVGQCNSGSTSGGSRTRFMSYGCNEPDRLYFIKLNPSETIYLGFNGVLADTDPGAHIVFRIKDISGTVVYPETSLPLSGIGFISTIAQARTGPNQIYTTGGYDAINFHPASTGTFYIEFTRINNSGGTVNTGGVDMKLIDITVYDTVAAQVKPGRLYSKSWQFWESSSGCSATTYVYSVDSITTSCTFNNMVGGIWVQFCNQWGCQNTGNFPVDRKSRNSQFLLPQFPIFINPPDAILFPPATTLGQIVPPEPYGVQDCNTGHITFHVNVNKPGNVEIDLTFGGPYVTRILNQIVVLGENLIIWDGLDGTLPTGVPVPNNVTVTFTVKYINGLTNLPFYDVEGNSNGFAIDIVSPPGTPPNVYWDDTNFGGTWGSNFTGCSTPPSSGCHTWSNPLGDSKTVNTWWYNVSSTTSPLSIPQWRKPQTLTFIQQPPQSYCAGATSVIFQVNTEPNTEQYHFSYTGTGATIIQALPTDSYVMVNFAANATSGNLEVYGTNFNCLTYVGPTSSLPITIKPVPIVDPPLAKSICSGNNTNITLNSTPVGSLFSWVSPPPSCTPNIAVCPPGTINSTQINDVLTVTDQNAGTVTYSISGTLNGCTGPTSLYLVTVNPFEIPVITGSNSECVGTTSVIYSTQAGMTAYSWSITSGGTITSGTSTNTVTVNWNTPGIQTLTLNYTDANGCTGTSPSSYFVNVVPLPVPSLSGPASACINTVGNIYTTDAGMTNYIWNVPPGGTITAGGTATSSSVTVTWTTTGLHTVSVNYTNLLGCSASSASTFNVTANPLPSPTLSGPLTVCTQTPGKVYTTENGMSNYIWNIPPGAFVTGGGGNSNNSVTITWIIPGSQTITVNYSNAFGCTTPSPASVGVLVNPLPDAIINLVTPSLCSGTLSNIQLSSSVSGTTFSWTASGSSANVSGFTPGVGNSIIQPLSNSGYTIDTVTYSIMPLANGCSPTSPSIAKVVVFPVPDLSNSPASKDICKGIATNITLTSNIAGTLFTWTCTASSGNVTGYSNNNIPTTSLNQILFNSGLTVEKVTYHIIPHANGCVGANHDFVVSVYQKPYLTMNPFYKTICSETGTGINLTSSLSGTSFSWVAQLGTGTISGFSNGAGPNINQILTNSLTTAGTVNYTISFSAGLCAGNDTTYVVTVNPKPHLTNNPANSQICSNSGTNISLQTDVTGTLFTWSATGSSSQVSGYSANSIPMALLNQTLINSGYNTEAVTYHITPHANGCDGPVADFVVTVFPVADVYFTPASQAVCPLQSCSITNNSHVALPSFSWTATGSSILVSGFSPGSGSSIQQILNNTGFNNEAVTYHVSPSANGCPGTASDVVVTVHPAPTVSLTICYDPVITTDAKVVKLKGGIPLGGSYSGLGIVGTNFFPAVAGAGNHTITYTYINTYGCNNFATQTINVISPIAFTCGNTLTDVRDNQQYPTAIEGLQCWMAANLNYGNNLLASNMQRDNCLPEKYCYNDNPGNCTSYGGLYQWDELMKYDNTSASQGLCPPSWHVPTETEWNQLFSYYISNGFAGSALKSTGFSNFNAFLDGARFKNVNWNFIDFATIFWSSDSRGSYKAWAHGMNTYNPSVSFYPGSRSNAFYVRCIKD